MTYSKEEIEDAASVKFVSVDNLQEDEVEITVSVEDIADTTFGFIKIL